MLALLGWFVPLIVGWRLPEGVPWLLLNAAISTVLMSLLGGAAFFILYGANGMPMENVFAHGSSEWFWYFIRLGIASALIWGPLMVLSLVNQPRRWVTKTW